MPLRVTVLYPLPLNAILDNCLETAALNNGGRFIGSGSDGETRDLCFDFPLSIHLIPFKTALFMAYALNCRDCRLDLVLLDD